MARAEEDCLADPKGWPPEKLERCSNELEHLYELSKAATTPLESEIKNLGNRVNALQMGISAAVAKQKRLGLEVVDREEKVAEHYVLFGKKIREILADKDLFAATHRLELQMLFAKDSRYHCENVILPVLARGDIVLTDRFRHSSCVYGAQKWNFLEIHMLMGMNQGCLGEYFVWPDCSFIFDLPAEIAFFRGLERAKKTGQKLDEMEKMETMERVKNNFYLFAQIYPDCHIIDADRTEEEIFVDVRNLLNETLIKKGWMQK